jgi:hypothetical protein
MKRLFTFMALMLCLAQAYAFRVEVENLSDTPKTDYPVVIDISAYDAFTSALVTCNGQEVPCQLDDLNQDGRFDELCFLTDLNAKERKTFKVEQTSDAAPRPYPARVYTEMVMRNDKVKEKNKHDNYVESLTARGDCANSYNLLHHHGVCFESELNGIRIYFDKRQTLDLYGKFRKGLELKETQFYTSDEQKTQGYGDDVLWVGNTFGLGALRGWDAKEQQPTMIEPVKSRTQRIISYGPLRTIVEIIDKGWQPDPLAKPVDMTIRYTQYAGHRDTNVDVFLSHKMPRNSLSTGIINVKGSTEYSDHNGTRACWGTDYPSTDHEKWKPETVGLAIWLPKDRIASEQPVNPDNYAFALHGDDNRLSYRVAYCSANESFGFHSAQEWFEWVKAWGKELQQPTVAWRCKEN